MPRLADDLLLEVVGFCISYLYEKCSNERGLFRSAVALTDVRLLQSQIAQGSASLRNDYDPHLVAETLQTSFKELEFPLFHEVYEDFVTTDLQDNDFLANKIHVQQWMQKIPEKKRSVTHSYFRLLSKLTGLEDTDVGMMQLIYSVSPTICRPLTCSYMSLRHKEDLNKIRPVVLFLKEHFQELFTFTKSFRVDGFGSYQASDKTDLISEMMTSAMIIDSTTPTNHSHPGKGLSLLGTTSDEEGNGSFFRPNLMLSIPPAISISASLEGNSMDDSDPTNNQSMNGGLPSSMQHSDYEWKVFHALVCHNAARFFQLDDKETTQLLANECGSDGHHAVMQAWTAKLSMPSSLRSSSTSSDASNNTMSNSQLPPSSSSSSSPAHSLMMKAKAGSPMSKSIGRRNRRRKMVSECKALRSTIQEFEQDFLKKHSRVPKAQERGLMHGTYIKYRDMKKEIRETAATDMTRLVRGFLARRMFARGMFISSTSDDLHNHSTSIASVKPHQDHPTPSLSINSTSSNNMMLNSDEINKFRDLISSKRELKRTLKKFDSDFQATHNRAPRKADKEAMRPLYQKYQEIKNSLEILRMALQTYDNLPEDVRVELLSPGASTPMGSGGGNNGWEQKRPSSYSDSEAEPDDHDHDTANNNSAKRNRLNTNVQSSTTASDVSAASAVSPMTTGTSVAAAAIPTLEKLQMEKRNLHEYLKVYERDFNRSHGRPVMKNEDILPVANEYQRYKELKTLIKDMKG